MITEKFSSLGVIVAAMGCASCFPVIASIGSSVGLGFLSAYEGLFINQLLPIFAIISLLINSFIWVTQRKWLRGILAITGPLMVLATLYLFWFDNWSTYLFYAGLSLMMIVALWDVLNPNKKQCNV